MKRFFVTGTDTDIGKTVLSGVLTHGLNAHYWKPVQSGKPTDSNQIIEWLGPERVLPERHVLGEPLSPNQSAERMGVRIELDDFVLPDVDGPLVVEGAGGLLVPLNDRNTILDLMVRLDLPVILAARSTLGTINHSLMSVETIRRAGLELAGIVFIGPEHPDNFRDITHFGKVPMIGWIPRLEHLGPDAFQKVFETFKGL